MKPPILGHESISTSIYPTILFKKYWNILSWRMKPFLLQYILQHTLLKYLTLQFLGNKAPSTSIYPTIIFKKYWNLLSWGMKPYLLQYILQYTLLKYLTLQFLGHKAPSTSIYPTILFKNIETSYPGAWSPLYFNISYNTVY